MKIGAPRLPRDSLPALIVRLGEIFGVVDRVFGRVENDATHNTRSIAVSVDGLLTDSIVFADASAGTLTYTLPDPRASVNKRIVVAKTTAGNAVIVRSPEFIDATTVVPLTTQFTSLEAASDGVQWYRI